MAVSVRAEGTILTKDLQHVFDEQELGLYICWRAGVETKVYTENLIKFMG